MYKLLTTTILSASLASTALAQDVKLGVFLGFTGPLESLVAEMGPAAELAIKEVSDSGKLMGGKSVSSVRGDTTCIDSGAGRIHYGTAGHVR